MTATNERPRADRTKEATLMVSPAVRIREDFATPLPATMLKIAAPAETEVVNFVRHALTCVDELRGIVADETDEVDARLRRATA